MKKTININLGGQAFIIDEEAFDILHRYFEDLKQKFSNENEQKEILADIEARIAEIFTERLGKARAVINEEDVVKVVSLMGRPEDIAGETDSAPTGSGNKQQDQHFVNYGKAEKKLFRDPDNKKVGGVISGLCYYFGWGDPTWIRILILGLFILSFFTHLGLGFPLAVIYLILLIVVPEAVSSSEKLQMKGEPVTIKNIEKEVRDAMTTAGQSINKMVRDKGTRGRLLDILITIGTLITKVVMLIVLIICVAMMLVLITGFFSLSFLSSSELSEITHLLVSSRYIIMLINIGILMVFGIPVLVAMYDAIRFLADSKARNPVLKRIFWAAWFGGIILLTASSWVVVKNFVAANTSIQKVQLLKPKGGTLRVQLADTLGHALLLHSRDDEGFSSFIHISGMSGTDYGFAFSDMKLEIAVSPDSNFYVEKVAFSRGSSITDAARNIQQMRYKFSQTDTTLNLDNRFELPKNGRWRAQHIKLRVYVPAGSRISFADNIDQMEATVKGNDYFDEGMLAGKTLTVDEGKLKCMNCKEKVIVDEEKDQTDNGDEEEDDNKPNGHVTVTSGDKKSELKDVSVNINQNGVSLTGKNEKDEKVKVKVNEHGVRVITTDTNGNTHISTK